MSKIIKKEYTVDEVFHAMNRARQHYALHSFSFDFDGDSKVGFNTLKMLNFQHNGITCKNCGIKGSIFRKEKHNKKISRWHLNLYARLDNGQLVLMTKDHIIPMSKGGENRLSNLQTLCEVCNNNKGNNMPHKPIPSPNFNIYFGNAKKRKEGRLTWNVWKRRFKYFFYTSIKERKFCWPSRAGSTTPDIRSFWKY